MDSVTKWAQYEVLEAIGCDSKQSVDNVLPPPAKKLYVLFGYIVSSV